MTEQTDVDNSTIDDDETTNKNKWEVWGLVVGSSLISTGLAAYEIVPASVIPVIRESLHSGPTATGLIVSIMFGTAVIASLPVGAILDRTNTRSVMGIAVLTLMVAGIWGWVGGQNGNYWSVIGSRALGGIAYVIVWNAGIDIVGRSVDSSQQATAVGMFTASGPIGFALGQGLGPIITAWFGWPAIFIAFNSLALIGLLLFWPTSNGLGYSAGSAPTLREFGSVLQNRSVWLVGGLGFLGYSLYLFVNSWGSSYLTESVGLSLELSGLLVALFPAVGILARMSSGPLSDRLFRGQRRPVVLGSFFIAAPLVISFTHLRSVVTLIAILLISGFAIQLTLGLSFTYVRELVDPRVAATAVAFQTSVGLAGAFLAPTAGGAIVDAAGFDTAFFVAGCLAVIGVGVAWQAPEPGNEICISDQ
ncbi:MFS transporter [Haladaptatus sp. DYF46]|uniref:MFS transporter n=1 Tax=Haladaptatus sp. DYF46 TaxID=2886041 RepID=UPI001E316333|nr:MFS transporter [Haladaptatus sp. DYF46]